MTSLAAPATLDRILDAAYAAAEPAALRDFARLAPVAGDRWAFAAEAVTTPHAGVLFRLLDAKPHAALTWRQLRPAATRPYRQDEG